MPSPLYGLVYDRRALAYLQTRGKKHRRQVIGKIDALASDPIPANSKLVRGMGTQEEPVRRVRSGDYRILYVVKDNPQHVVILHIGHRRDVYR